MTYTPRNTPSTTISAPPRAEYGAGLIRFLAERLTREFGKGFDESSLRQMRQFYQIFPIRATVSHKLSWSHYRLLMKIENAEGRESVKNEIQKTEPKTDPGYILKDPYILEFLDLKENKNYHESELEQALVDHLQEFLLELGKGFSFIARQKRITIDGDHYS
jgi:predicted nuclease of restriction endonuclease-like (RecB) superfamily